MRTTTTLLSLTAAVILAGCYKQDDYDPLALHPNEVIDELRISKDTLLANNLASATIIAFLPDGGQEGLDVTFTTDKGVFTDGGLNSVTVKTKAAIVDDEVRIIAEATLRNGLGTGWFDVTAALGGYERSDSIYSANNPPTDIAIVVPALVLQNDSVSEMDFYAQLTAQSGTVSLGHDVVMEARDPAQNPLGTFRVMENESNSEGRCRYVFTMTPNWTYTGPLIFTATHSGPTGTHQASRTIQIIN